MFWDTCDFWTDDSKTRQVKAYRRKSNYYEKKKKSLENYLDIINGMLQEAENNYHLGTYTTIGSQDDVLHCLYFETESKMYQQTDELLESLKTKKESLKKQKDKAKELYQKYYNLAIKEDRK